MSNVGYDQVDILNNEVRNFSELLITFPASGPSAQYLDTLNTQRGRFHIVNNIFENDGLIDIPSGRVMMPVLTKGGDGDFLFEGNLVKNLLSSTSDAAVNTLYYTGTKEGSCVVQGNTFLNVLNGFSTQGAAHLIKIRGGTNLIYRNNRFEIQKQSLVQLGVIDSLNHDLSTIDHTDIKLQFMQVGSQTNKERSMVMKGNEFIMPYMNMSTEVYDFKNFDFQNNTWRIGHFGLSGDVTSVDRAASIFYSRQRVLRPDSVDAGSFISQGNTISIGASDTSLIEYVSVLDGTQNDDQEYRNYDEFIINDKVFLDSVIFAISLYDSDRGLISSDIVGEKSSISITDYSNVSHDIPNIPDLNTDICISDYKYEVDRRMFTIGPKSTQRVEIKNNTQDTVSVFSFGNTFALYNINTELPIDMFIAVNYRDTFGVEGSTNYHILYDDNFRSLYFEEGGTQVGNGFSAHTTIGEMHEINGAPLNDKFDFVMTEGNFDSPQAKFRLHGTSDISYLDIKIITNSMNWSGDDADYNNHTTTQKDIGVYGNVLNDYGLGNKEASDLSKIHSGYIGAYGNDGSILEMSYAELADSLPINFSSDSTIANSNLTLTDNARTLTTIASNNQGFEIVTPASGSFLFSDNFGTPTLRMYRTLFLTNNGATPPIIDIATANGSNFWRFLPSSTSLTLRPLTVDASFIINNQASTSVLSLNTSSGELLINGVSDQGAYNLQLEGDAYYNGSLTLAGATSGATEIIANAVAGTSVATLQAVSGTLAYLTDIPTAPVTATEATEGIVELATVAELDAGTDASRVPNVDNLAGSDFGTKELQIEMFDASAAVTTGDGNITVTIPASMDGYDLVNVVASVHDKGITGTTDVTIERWRAGAAADMLSTAVTLGDEWFAEDGAIDTANDDVNTGDRIYVNVDVLHSGTAPNGLSVVLEFRKP